MKAQAPSHAHQRRQQRQGTDVALVQGTNGGEAFQFGAARDAQTAADTSQLSGNVSTGAATFSFIQVHWSPLLTLHHTGPELQQ